MLLRRGGLVELDGDVGGDVGGAAAALRGGPGIRVEKLAAVVAAVRHAGAIECRVGAVKFLLSVTLHEEVDRHHSSALEQTNTELSLPFKSTVAFYSPPLRAIL